MMRTAKMKMLVTEPMVIPHSEVVCGMRWSSAVMIAAETRRPRVREMTMVLM